jgi:hypothetical protein
MVLLQRFFVHFSFQVVETFVLTDYRGMSRGSGFVKMKTKEQAIHAINSINNTFIVDVRNFVNLPFRFRILISPLKSGLLFPNLNELGRYFLLFLSSFLSEYPDRSTQPRYVLGSSAFRSPLGGASSPTDLRLL